MSSSERSHLSYNTLPPKLPQQTCLTPARGSEAGTTPIVFTRNEINVLLKQLRQQPTDQLLQIHDVPRFLTKILSLFPDEFLFPLLEYAGKKIVFSKPAVTVTRTRLAKTTYRQQTKLVLGFKKSCLPHGDEAFDTLTDTFSDIQFSPEKKAESFDPNYNQKQSARSVQQPQLENCSFIQLPQSDKSNVSSVKIDLRTPSKSIYNHEQNSPSYRKSPITALKTSSSSSQRSSNQSSNNNHQLPVPSLGIVNADISNGQETYKIPVINDYNRIQPTKFEYQAYLPDMAPNQITNAESINIRSKILEIQKQKIKRVDKTCGASCESKEFYSSNESNSDENIDSSDGICRNCACSKSVQNFPSYVRKQNSSSRDSDSSDSSSSECLVINPKLLSDEQTNEIFECGQNCCCNPLECENRLIQRSNGKMTKKVEIKMTESMGYGLFSKYSIEKGQYLGPYTGKIVLYDERNWNQLCEIGKSWDDSYFFETCLESEENRVIVDSKHWGNASRFINHACEPNVKVVHVICEKFTVPIIALFAAENIKASDQLFIDYTDSYWIAKEEEEDSSTQKFCTCGSRNCRYKNPDHENYKGPGKKRKKKEFSVKRGRSVADDQASKNDSCSVSSRNHDVQGDYVSATQNRRHRIKHVNESMQLSEPDEFQITKDCGETNSSTSLENSRNEPVSKISKRPERSRGRQRELNYDLLN
jgi:hypothetical protein